MLRASELKRGSIVSIDTVPHVVEQFTVQTPSARGGASLYKIRFRDLVSKRKVDKVFKGDDALQDVDVTKREVQFSYAEPGSYVFMDLEDYSEFRLSSEDIEEEAAYLHEGLEGIQALLSDGHVLTIELPPVVEMAIKECDPSIKGASATARTKPAKLVTGLIVQVPEYLSQGETIRVDTRTGKFLSRA